MGLASTDYSEQIYTTDNGLLITQHFLPEGEYKVGPTNKEYCFWHHTAGWQNPYKQIDSWGRDKRGAVGTEFCIVISARGPSELKSSLSLALAKQ